jgi:Holliday junction resolvasome RuvABC endonuclease subunit
MKTILALDLGTHCGWAYRSRSGDITAGTWELAKAADITKAGKLRMDRRLDPRIPALYRRLRSVWNDNVGEGPNNPIDFIVFEDVQFSSFTQQTQLWSSLRAAVWLFAYLHQIPTDCIPVKTLKLFATGSGAADKEFMIECAAKLFPEIVLIDDNCADALHILRWAFSITNNPKKTVK